MTRVTAPVKAPGGVTGTGSILVVEHTTDNRCHVPVQSLRRAHVGRGEDFLFGRHVPRRRDHRPEGDRATLEARLTDLGLSAWTATEAPDVTTHELDVPRIGYVHSWTRTQDEGWVSAALDTFGVPYTYFGDIRLRDGNLRAKYDVIVFPHVGGTCSRGERHREDRRRPTPYKKTEKTPNLGVQDQADDIRGGMGFEGLMNLYQFVKDGGLLIVEGSTSTIFPEEQARERHHRRES